jgi:hypothetical protein
VPAASDQRSGTRLAWTILPPSVAGGTTVSNDLLQPAVAIATPVVIVVGVTIAIVELR